VKKYKFEDPDFVVVTFDDEKTSVKIIEKKIKESGNPVKGDAVYLP
jgi:hypothetical protein